MIDINAHILPGIEGGCQSTEQALEILRQAEKCGIKSICVTAPLFSWSGKSYIDKVKRKFEILKENQNRIELHLGFEIYLEPNLPWMENLADFTLAQTGRYLLIELPNGEIPGYLENIVYHLKLAEITPILAHPERNLVSEAQIKIIEKLVNQGALVQLDAGSILRANGKDLKKLSGLLLQKNLVHFIATNGRDEKEKNIQSLILAYEEAQKIIGEEKAFCLVKTNPQKVLCKEEVLA